MLVIGHERQGLDQATLDVLDAVVEIPVFGLPYSYNIATATAMAMYEYCRQMVRRTSPEACRALAVGVLVATVRFRGVAPAVTSSPCFPIVDLPRPSRID